jgi:two-component system response regulator RegA
VAVSAREIRSVLVVDDDARTLSSLARMLGRQRTTFTASDPASAIDVARREQPDLAIVDLRLGKASGVDLVRELKAVDPKITVALISGYLSIDTTVHAVHAGADYVLSKPVTARDILTRIEHGLGSDIDLGETPTLAEAAEQHVTRVLSDCNGNISEAARRLGICRSSLQRRLRKTTTLS